MEPLHVICKTHPVQPAGVTGVAAGVRCGVGIGAVGVGDGAVGVGDGDGAGIGTHGKFCATYVSGVHGSVGSDGHVQFGPQVLLEKTQLSGLTHIAVQYPQPH